MLAKVSSNQDVLDLGKNVREARKVLGLSQTSLANKASLTRNTVSGCESATTTVTVDSFFALADALGVTPNDLSPSRFRKVATMHALSQLDPRFDLLKKDEQELLVSTIAVMITGFLSDSR